MGWFANYPYKWQCLLTTLGLVSTVGGLVFLLIAYGTESKLWDILGGILLASGILLSIVASVSCARALKQPDDNMNGQNKLHIQENESALSGFYHSMASSK